MKHRLKDPCSPSSGRLSRSESGDRLSSIAQSKSVPPYLKRICFFPRKPEDFGDGGAFPELISLPQYPLGMGLPSEDLNRRQLRGIAAYDARDDVRKVVDFLRSKKRGRDVEVEDEEIRQKARDDVDKVVDALRFKIWKGGDANVDPVFEEIEEDIREARNKMKDIFRKARSDNAAKLFEEKMKRPLATSTERPLKKFGRIQLPADYHARVAAFLKAAKPMQLKEPPARPRDRQPRMKRSFSGIVPEDPFDLENL